MAIQLGGTGQYLRRTTNLPASNAITVAAWIKIRSIRAGAYQYFLGFEDAVTSSSNYLLVGFWDFANTFDFASNGGSVQPTAPATNTWYFFAITNAGSGANNAKLYYGPAGGSLSLAQLAGVTFTPAVIHLGNDSYDEWCNVDVGPNYIYDAVLSQIELEALRSQVVPVWTANLNSWSPGFAGATERLADYSGNGRNWTQGGTVTDVDGPPVPWSLGIIPQGIWVSTAAGPILLAVGGSVIPAGTLLKQANKNQAGAMAPTGSLLKLGAKALAGAVVPAGNTQKLLARLLNGSLTPGGVMNRQVAKEMVGSITPTGNTVKQLARRATGSISPAGSLLRQAKKQVTGSLTPAGTVASIRTVLLSLLGALTPSGVVARQARLLETGTVQPEGAVIKTINRGWGGSVTPAGTLIFVGTILLSVAGSLTPTGAVGRLVSQLLAGEMIPGGSVNRLAGKVLSGSVTPGGTLAQVISNVLSLAGTLAPAGALGRQVNKAVSGVLVASGSLSKLASRLFRGAVSPSGLVSFGETVINEVQTLAKAMAKAMFKRMR